jgi:hypothetical protein
MLEAVKRGRCMSVIYLTFIGVVDPYHVGTDPDLRIRTPDLQIRIWILLFSSVADKMPTILIFFKILCLLLFEGKLSSVFIDTR